MNEEYIKRLLLIILPALISTVLLGGVFAYAYTRVTSRMVSLSAKVDHLTAELASTTVALSSRADIFTKDILTLDQRTAGLSDVLSSAERDIKTTRSNIEIVQTRVGGFEEKVGEISGTVSTLEKLSKTDPELLQKYSKVFFLNEHYVPDRLVEIDPAYLYSERTAQSIHALVRPRLKELMDAAKKDKVTIYVKSAYRSFEEQKNIKSAYTVTYGAGTANQFSAEQGYSEHQLGTTVDFISTGLGGNLVGFEKTAPYTWLINNAYRYGFILSYYEGNPYYLFEPWHWRFVGVKIATYLHDANKHFYDLDQREIDAYLANIFD